MLTLEQLTAEIKALTPIPVIANKLMSLVDSPNSSMKDIADIIQYDPMITASILKTCNSAYFGLKNPVESIKDAVNMLGTDQVVEIALMKSGVKTLSGKQEGYGLEKGDMWKYAISSAVTAKLVARRLSIKNTSTIFTCALLKDIGKIILEKHVHKFSGEITDLVNQKGLSFLEAEKKILGIDHAQLGAMIAKRWKFSPKMIKIIRHHHLSDASMAKDKEITAVYIADCICMMMGLGVGSDGLSYRFKQNVIADYHLTADDISMIIADFAYDMQEIEVLLNIT